MNNKVSVTNQKYNRIKLITFFVLLPTIMAIIVLFTYRALDTRNYNGIVKQVSGVVTSIEKNDDVMEITLDYKVTYNASRIHNCYPNFNLNSLKNKQVTFYVPDKQMGLKPQPWVIGIELGDETLIDYHEVIADGKVEAKWAMIVSGVVTGLLAVLLVGLYFWRIRLGAITEEDLYKHYCEFEMQRQPSCPQYKYLGIAALIYVAVTMVVGIVISVVCSVVQNLAVQISVAVVMCVIFVGSTVGLLVLSKWITKKEHNFYAENYPFDLTDISHIVVAGKQKKLKQQVQAELIEARKNHPNRYIDAGNGFVVDFVENGVEFYDENAIFPTPGADFVFAEGEETQEFKPNVYRLTYQQLNFEALPFYRKKNNPLTVVIKSRITDNHDLPEEMEHDLHFMLDINLLSTLHQFDVPVDNLQYILENKAQLISENCERRKNKK